MYLLSAECIWLPIFGMNRAWQRLPALRQFPPPFSLLPPPHPAPPSTFTAVSCDVHGPMRTVLNGSRMRIEGRAVILSAPTWRHDFSHITTTPICPLQFSARTRTCPILNTCTGPSRHLQSWHLSGISAGRVCGCTREAVPRRFTITTAT
ncbi:hypothetical protein B0H14DRAFT_2821701 [Mycena olivaceomarginata]|nr:hypothetical protein B0H14DRAFT_2821701 [Mycena olivaceomarginata]